MKIRIGYEHADRKISYPHTHNLSVCVQPIRVSECPCVVTSTQTRRPAQLVHDLVERAGDRLTDYQVSMCVGRGWAGVHEHEVVPE